MHMPSLVKRYWHLLKLPLGNKNKLGCGGQIALFKKQTKHFQLAIPNQISTTQMHIPDLVKIF